MPFSQSSQISVIVQYFEELKPQSIMDVGVGLGQYGFLARINVEHLNLLEDIHGAKITQRPRDEWQIRIDGIEGYENYRTPIHDYIYDHIYYEEALQCLTKIPDNTYELVMAIDIIEHFTKEKGIEFMSHLHRISSNAVLISTPKEFIEQEISGNSLEDHLSHWANSELSLNNNSRVLENDFSWVIVNSVNN